MSKRKVVPPAEKFLSGVIVYEACSDRQLLDMIAKCAATLRERMDRSAPAAPKASEPPPHDFNAAPTKEAAWSRSPASVESSTTTPTARPEESSSLFHGQPSSLR